MKIEKTIVFMMLAMATIITNCNAQDQGNPRSKFYVGAKGGINYSNVYDTEGEKFQANAKVGFVGGVFLTIPIGELIGFQPELLFSQKGFNGSGVLFGTPYSISRTTNYIDVPLLFSVKPSSLISLHAGPQFSYLLRQKDEFSNTTMSSEQIKQFSNDNVRKNTLCFLGGVDLNVNSFVIGTRIGWDIQNNNGDGTSTTPRYKNRWLQATLGYRF
jgi:hypothetical protein